MPITRRIGSRITFLLRRLLQLRGLQLRRNVECDSRYPTVARMIGISAAGAHLKMRAYRKNIFVERPFAVSRQKSDD